MIQDHALFLQWGPIQLTSALRPVFALFASLLLAACDSRHSKPTGTVAGPALEMSFDKGLGETVLVVKWRNQPANHILLLNCDSCTDAGERETRLMATDSQALPGYTCATRMSTTDGSCRVRLGSDLSHDPSGVCIFGAVVPSIPVQSWEVLGPSLGRIPNRILLQGAAIGFAELPESRIVWLAPDTTVTKFFPDATPPPIKLATNALTICSIDATPHWIFQHVP